MMRNMLRLRFFSLIYLALASTAALSQNSQGYLNDIGGTPYGVNIPVENGFINVSNGNLHLEFPLATHPQRGALRLSEKLVYDSRIWMFSPFGSHGSYHWWPYNVNAAGGSNTSGGWRFVKGNEIGSISYQFVSSQTSICNPDDNQQVSDYVEQILWIDPNGTTHPFSAYINYHNDQCANFSSQTLNPGPAADGSGYSASDDGSGNPVITDSSGSQVYPQVIDRYGNFWSTDGNGNLVDDTGRTPVIATQNGNVTYYDVLAPNGPINNNGTRVRYAVTSASVPVATDFQQSNVYEWNPSVQYLTPVQSISLPDGSQYTFSYDGYGGLSSVTLPTGGVVQYGYTNFVDSSNTANRWLSSRTQGSNPPMTFTPSVVTACSNYSTGCVESVNLHKPSGDETVYQLTLINGAWNTGTTTYTGAAAGGQVLLSTTTVDGYTNGCNGAYVCPGGNYLSQSLATTVLYSNGSPSVSTQTQELYNVSVGKISAVKEWDYGANFSGTPTRETDYAYTGLDVQQVTVLSNGSQAGQTTYGYTSSATTTSGVAQHGTQNSGGPYLQTISHWLNTGSPSITTNTMDDTGQVLSTSDPNGNPPSTISYQYQCANSLPYQTTNALNQTTTYGYDCNSGAITSVHDPNDTAAGRSGTTYAYEGTAGRLQSVSSPDGGQTNYYFTDINTFWTDHPLNGTTPAHFVTHTDGYNRLDRTALFTGNDWYQIDYCFDVTGLLQFQSARYEGSGFSGPNANKQCAGNGTSYIYDALGRVTSTTNADGTAYSQYQGRAVLTTDVNGVQKIVSQNGRTSDICEVSSSTLQGESPQTCPGDIGGYTGFVTHSDYDLTNHKTTITQGVQQRVFQTDSAGRTIYTSEPERGVTTYSYAYNSSGLVVTRKRPRANQADPNVLTTTTTQYDAVGRVLSISYDDGTPTKNFGYDVSANWAILNQTNFKGMLSAAWIPGVAASVFSYDPMGRVNAMAECVPSQCGNSPLDKRLDYAYDLAGNMTSSSDGAGVTTSYTYSPASEVQTITSSLNDATHPGTLVSNVQNGPNGPLGYSLGNGLTNVSTRDTLGRMNGGSFCSGSSAFYCVGGTAVYWFTNAWKGDRSLGDCDTGFNQCLNYGYDEFNRLASRSSSGNTEFTYVYDRYGNRWQQNAFLGGPSPQLTFNTATNQVSGYTYDAAGNVLNDGFNSYQYDAEGNLIQTNTGSATFQYTYNALNQQVRFDYNSSTFSTYIESIFNAQGKFSANWNKGIFNTAEAYWGSTPIEAYFGSPSLTAHFLLRDALGSMRFETDNTGAVTVNRYTLEFGDGTTAVSGSRNTNDGFAGMPDGPSGNHAQFRDYSNVTGRWMSPDPYDGSMDLRYPQTLNRYAYVGNNPLSFTDPLGLKGCGVNGEPACQGDGSQNQDRGEWWDPFDWGNIIASWFHHPAFHGTTHPRPTVKASGTFGSVNCAPDGTCTLPVTYSTGGAGGGWGDHYLAAQVFQGPGSGSFVAANTAVTYGTYGYTAAYGAAFAVPTVVGGMGTADVAVGFLGDTPHAAIGVDGAWMHGLDYEVAGQPLQMTSEYAESWATRTASYTFRVPIPFPGAVLPAEGAPAFNCITGACSAIFRGWIP
jgi:RHS repeat-associated protein